MQTLNSRIRLCVFPTLLIVVFFSSAAFAKNALNFSRSRQQLPSPDRLYVIHNLVASENRGSDLLYVATPDELLITSKAGERKRTKLLNYHRNVDVFWAPDSKAFVVNDWKNNSCCDAVLYKVGSLQKPISLKQNLIASGISADERARIFNKDHSYLFVDRWDKPTEVVVKASGHYFLRNKTVSYTFLYLWDLQLNKWKLLKKDSTENLERDVPNMAQFGA